MTENVFGRNGRRISRKVLYERPFDHDHRVVSYALDQAAVTDREGFLLSLERAQAYAERDAGGRPCILELVATVQHGWPIGHSWTMHFEVTPCAA